MAIKAIINGKLIMKDRLINDGVVLIKEDRIIGYGVSSNLTVPTNAEIIDANGLFVGPGFIDIHNHGGGGYWAHEDPLEFAKAHLQYGTTGVLPTLAYILDRNELMNGVNRVIDVMEKKEKYYDTILGIHLEGPFLNPKFGAETSNIRAVDQTEYLELLKIAGDKIKVWTLAPEMQGQMEFVEKASLYKNIVFSAGHSESDAKSLYQFVPYGLKLACHCMNATGTTPSKSRFGGTREVGLDEAVLVHDEISAEIIPDAAGIHVRPLMLKLILKAKGIDKVIIITDAMKEAGLENIDYPANILQLQEFSNYNDINFTEKYQLNGSRLTMDRAVFNVMQHTSVSIVEAFRMASYNPAKILSLDNDVGSIDVGNKANLVIVDENVKIHSVYFNGEEIIS